MFDSILSPTILTVCFLGGAGIYLLLAGDGRAAFWMGAASAGLALVLLSIDVMPPAAWWSESELSSRADSLLFHLLGLSSLITAAMTVTARKATRSGNWFLATLILLSSLYAIHNAQVLAAATLLVAAGGTGTLLLYVARRAESLCGGRESAIAKEPLLACVAGGLLAACLIGTIQRSPAEAPARAFRPARSERSVERHPADLQQSRIVQAGRSTFGDHPVAVGTLMALLLVALPVAVRLLRGSTVFDGTIPDSTNEGAE